MKLRKLVCTVVSAVMLVTGVGVMSTSADSKSGGYVKYDGGDWEEGGGYSWNDPIDDFITRLYSLSLQRQPDSTGLDQWRSVLVGKRGTGISVAYGFIYSSEFQNRNVTNEEYVELMYQMFFGRAADAAGKEGWVNVLNSMGREEGRLDVFNGFANSVEFFNLCNSYGITAGTFVPDENVDRVAKVNLFVDRLYEIVLNRQCDMNGMADWTSRLLSGSITGAEAGYGFFFSQEYDDGNSGFVYDLYRAFLGRNGDQSGLNAWNAELALGASREQVFNGFTQSQEFTNICNDYGIERGGPIPEPATSRVSVSNTLAVWGTSNEVNDVSSRSSVPVESQVIDASGFTSALDMVLASGDNCPDIIFIDNDYVPRYLYSDATLPVSSLGIADTDLSDMFTYSIDRASYNGQVHGLSYCVHPSVVFYNRDLAARTLGVSSPEEVAPYFTSWDAFLGTARTVNSVSHGAVKVISGPDDVYHAYLSRRTQTWNSLQPNDSNGIMGIFDLARTLVDESLTFQTSQWMEGWIYNMESERVLSYWGPDWLARYSMGLDTSLGGENPTAGHWGAVRGPEDWYWGGTYVAATRYCRDTAAAGQFMRSAVMDPGTAESLHSTPNSRSTLAAWASDPSHDQAMLGGQNPYGLYAQVAEGITVSPDNPGDTYSNTSLFMNAVSTYVYGEIESSEDAFNLAMEMINEAQG